MTDLFTRPDCDSFYEAMPRKVGKKDTRKAYKSAIKEVSAERLQCAAEAFAAIENERTGYQKLKGKARQEALKYTVHPATWLNQGRWEDEVIEEYLSKPKEEELEPITFPVDDIWKDQKERLLKIMGPVVYRSWFVKMTLGADGQDIIATFPTRFLKDWVQKTYKDDMETVWGYRVRFEYSPLPGDE